mgnify:CR=1 FL=1
MITFSKETITTHIDRIRGAGDVCMYYVHGSQSGALIDTGYGVGDLKEFIEKTYHQNYEVIITHGHADHANGIAQWNKVWMNTIDKDLYFDRSSITLRKEMLKKKYSDIETWDDSLFQPVFKGEFIHLEEGMTFDLGGVSLLMIHAPGHTQGMMVPLVKEDRVAIFGDACGVFTFLFRQECSSVNVYRQTLLKLKSYENQYDRILRQHGTCESPKSLTDENLEVAQEILNGTDEHIPFEYLGYHAFIAKQTDPQTGIRADGKSGNIVYAQDKIW